MSDDDLARKVAEVIARHELEDYTEGDGRYWIGAAHAAVAAVRVHDAEGDA